jgi:MinD-like ATPase involved in chromosome partitioning or flagellar assembly
MATTTPNFGWPVPTSTDLVKDGATAIEGLGDAIDASLLDLKGGTSGQVLAKNSGTDMDFIWVAQDDSNAIQNAIVDAKGDLIAATAADTPARLGVGANGTVLTADSAEATGLKWATPAGGGGKVLQVIQGTTSTAATNNGASYADTNLTATITPSASSSKVLVLVTQLFTKSADNANNGVNVKLLRGATDLQTTLVLLKTGTAIENIGHYALNYLDTPATTSATTYKTQFANQAGVIQVGAQPNNCPSTIILLEIGA